MFGSIKSKKGEASRLAEKAVLVDQDLVVRNMPRLANFQNQNIVHRTASQSGFMPPVSNPGNSKKIGLLIIIGGLLLVAALVYVSFSFIIKPQMSSPAPQVVSIPEENTDENTLVTEAAPETKVLQPETAIATITPVALEIASSSVINEAVPVVASSSAVIEDEVILPSDEDGDGLSAEEEVIFGTDPRKSDSNNNSYADLVEVENGYDPANPGSLETNRGLRRYQEASGAFSFLYPASWKVSELGDGSTFVFAAPDNSIIQLSVQDNFDKQSILGWYSALFPEDTITYDKLKTNVSWDGLASRDGLNFYIGDKSRTKIYAWSYIPALDNYQPYGNVFKMMFSSFTLKQ